MAIDLRPLTAAELLDRAFFFYRKHFLLFVGIVVIPMLVNFLANVVYIGIYPPPANSEEAFRILMQPERIILVFIGVLVMLFAQGAVVAAVSDVYLARPSGIGKSFARLRGNLLNLLFAMIFMNFVIALGFVFLIVPGIIFGVALILTIPAAVIENRTPVDAMKRSWELTKGGRWRILGVLAAAYIVYFIVGLVLQIPGAALTIILRIGDSSNVSALPQIVQQIGDFFASCLAFPLLIIASSLLYYDQRVRKEGFDLQFMADSLESKTDETNPPEIF